MDDHDYCKQILTSSEELDRLEALLEGEGYSSETLTISEIDSSDGRSDNDHSDNSVLNDARVDDADLNDTRIDNVGPNNAIDLYQPYFHSLDEAIDWLFARRILMKEGICFRCNKPGMSLKKMSPEKSAFSSTEDMKLAYVCRKKGCQMVN